MRRSARAGAAGSGPARCRGAAYAIEYLLVLMLSLSLFIPLAEFLRLSLFDQALARATHQAARAAAGSPPADAAACRDRVTGVYQSRDGDTLIGWLFDANDDDRVDVAYGDGWPAGAEVQVALSGAADLGADVAAWAWGPGCAPGGSLTVLRSRVVVRGWSVFARAMWPNGFSREHVSWAAG